MVAECDPDRDSEASGDGIELMHKQACMTATFVQELKNEEHFTADFANGAV